MVTAARWGGIAMVLTALAISGTLREPPARAHLEAGGYTVLAGDLHVHGYPDGIPPWDAAREARRRRLDMIALTSHNSRFGWWMWTHRPSWAPADVLVLPGEELTSVGYHMAVVGLSRAIGWNQPIVAAAAAAHQQGAIAILAHPSGAALKRVASDDALRAVDGIEVAHPGTEDEKQRLSEYRDFVSRAQALNPRTAAIGSSDFHYFEPLGLCRTYVFVHQAGAAAVLDAIRLGRTVACDARGGAYGPAELRPLVAERCLEDATLPPEGDSPASRLATALAWAGLLALVLAGAAGT